MADVIHLERPPLDEVVCGVQFGGVEWSGVHFGLLYTQLDGRYQRTQQRPPILPSLFETSLRPAQVEVVVTHEPGNLLLWYESENSPFLLQVQKDAFFVNWRHQSGAFVYPHFHTRVGGKREYGIGLAKNGRHSLLFASNTRLERRKYWHVTSPILIIWYVERRGKLLPTLPAGSAH